jgi:hypothetical protein
MEYSGRTISPFSHTFLGVALSSLRGAGLAQFIGWLGCGLNDGCSVDRFSEGVSDLCGET